MCTLEPYFPSGKLRKYCLACREPLDKVKSLKGIDVGTFRDCGLDPDVLDLRKQQGTGFCPVVHEKCYKEKLKPARDAQLAKPRTRAHAAASGVVAPAARRAAANQETKLAALKQELGSSLTGVTLGSYALRAGARAQATSLAVGCGVAAAEVMATRTPVASPIHPTAAMVTSTSTTASSPGAAPQPMDTGATPAASPGGVTAHAAADRPAFTGISWDSSVAAWRARCPREFAGGQQLFLGTYKLQEQAALAVNCFHDRLQLIAAGRLAVPPAPNAVPAGVSLGLQATLLVQSKATDALLACLDARMAALEAQQTQQPSSPAVMDFVAARELVPGLDAVVGVIADGQLPPDHTILEYVCQAVPNAAKLQQGGAAANGVRWTPRIKTMTAAAASQPSGEACLNVMRGGVGDCGLPFPSTSTVRRVIGDGAGAAVGVDLAAIRAFTERCKAMSPDAPLVASLAADGTDIKATLEKVALPSGGVRFEGDACLGDSLGTFSLCQKEDLYNSMMSELDAAADTRSAVAAEESAAVTAAAADAAKTAAAAAGAEAFQCVQRWSAWIARALLPEARTRLLQAEKKATEQQEKFARSNRAVPAAAAGVAPITPVLKPQQNAAACRSLQLVERRRAVVARAEGLVLTAQLLHNAKLVQAKLACSAVGRVTVSVTTVSNAALAQFAASVAMLALDMRVVLAAELFDVTRVAADSLLAVMLTSPDCRVSAVVARLYVAGKASKSLVRGLIDRVSSELRECGGQLLSAVVDGEFYELTNSVGAVRPSNPAQLNKASQRQCRLRAEEGKRPDPKAKGEAEAWEAWMDPQAQPWQAVVAAKPTLPSMSRPLRGAATSAPSQRSTCKVAASQDPLLKVAAALANHKALVASTVAAVAATVPPATAATVPPATPPATLPATLPAGPPDVPPAVPPAGPPDVPPALPPAVAPAVPPAALPTRPPAAPAPAEGGRPKRARQAPARFRAPPVPQQPDPQPSQAAAAPSRKRDGAAVALMQPADNQFCMVCGSTGAARSMLLCDGPCNQCQYAGWHLGCIRPALPAVPDGDWLCPRCETEPAEPEQQLPQVPATQQLQQLQQDVASWFEQAVSQEPMPYGLSRIRHWVQLKPIKQQPTPADLFSPAASLVGSQEQLERAHQLEVIVQHCAKMREIEAVVPLRVLETPVQQLVQELAAHPQAAQRPRGLQHVAPQIMQQFRAYMTCIRPPTLTVASPTATCIRTCREWGLAEQCSGGVDAAEARKDAHAAARASRIAPRHTLAKVLRAEAEAVRQLVAELPVVEGTAVVAHLIWRSQHLVWQAVLPGDRNSAAQPPPAFPAFSNAATEVELYWIYRLTHDMLPAGLSAKAADSIIQQAVDQAAQDRFWLDCKLAGRDFSLRFQYVALGDIPVSIDEPHKIKTAKPQDNECCFIGKLSSLAAMQRAAQHRCGGGGSGGAAVALSGVEAAAVVKAAACPYGEACLDRGVLLAVAEELEAEHQQHHGGKPAGSGGGAAKDGFHPSNLLAILRGDTDTQSVACAQYWLRCQPLQDALRARGFVLEAVVMRTLIEAFEAFDECGLEPVERALRILRRTHMLQRMLGNTLTTARVLRGSKEPSLPQYVCGFTLQNVLSWLINGDVRLEVLQRLPEKWRVPLCERALSSDCCELFFSLLVGLCGGKPSVRVIKGATQRISFLHRLSQAARSDRGFSMRKRRTRGGYKEHELMLKAVLAASGDDRAYTWNSGAKLANAALTQRRQARIVKRVRARVVGKAGSYRQVIHLKRVLGC